MAKNNNKSVRLSDKVYTYIQNYVGDGFNEKFENIILYAMESEKDRDKRIKNLDEQIAKREKELNTLINNINAMKGIEYSVKGILSSMESLKVKMHNIKDL